MVRVLRACLVLTLLFLVSSGSAGRADPPADFIALSGQVALLYKSGKYAEASVVAQRALALAEQKLGKEDANTIATANILAMLYRLQGRYAEAEALYRRVLDSRERLLGPEHTETLSAVNNLALIYNAQGRHAEAEPLLRRVLENLERVLGKEHASTLASRSNLALLYNTMGRYPDAESLLRRSLEDAERALGKEHDTTVGIVNNLAIAVRNLGRYAEAEQLYRRALETSERVLGKEHPNTFISINNLADLFLAQGRYADAEPLYRGVLAAHERLMGMEHPRTLVSVNNLASLYDRQGRYAEAEPLLRRALEVRERVLGNEHPDTLVSVNNLASLFDKQGRLSDAEQLYRRAFESSQRVYGNDHPSTLASENNLAAVIDRRGRFSEAEPHYRRVLEVRKQVLGKEHPDTLVSVNNLGTLYRSQGKYAKAEPLYRRALAGAERRLGKEHPLTLICINNLANLYYDQRDWTRAAFFWRRSIAGIRKRVQRAALDTRLTGKANRESQRSDEFYGLVKAVYRLALKDQVLAPTASREMFQTVQWALGSETAQSVTQMAARASRGNGPLAKLVRERQDLVAEWQRLELRRNIALGQETATRDASAEAVAFARLSQIDVRIGEIDGKLSAEFRGYAALANPAPLSVKEVQGQLATNEALVLFFVTGKWNVTPEETFIWVITKTGVRWARSAAGTEMLSRNVQALRCGLDASAAMEDRCKQLTGKTYTEADAANGRLPVFDRARAHKLYVALFGEVEDMIKGKHLIIVPSGPLTQLPFNVLLTAAPDNIRGHKSAPWLARRHAVSILPAVSSLKALRSVARRSTATKPMIGFGNPLLDGPQNDAKFGTYFKKRAQLARDKQQCQPGAIQKVASFLGWRGVQPMDMGSELVPVSHIRVQPPLPETTDELCAVARHLKADPRELWLGARATEQEVKLLSAKGELARYRIVHFATHGAMAGELKGAAEPGLLLTPPDVATEEDDGYLSASEIATLKLDADWVILSACNTAAGDAANAEALSGLARAFIYAQARTLLVSHWAVDSGTTVKLITGAVHETGRDPKVGRAEAVRRSMLALIDRGQEKESHPAFWAPFVVVGEGAH